MNAFPDPGKLIIVVGAGALGSHVVQFLRGVNATIRVIDFDRVELKNALSQFHGHPHVGKLKTESLRQTMKLLWGTPIEIISNKLTKDNYKQLLAGDLVIDCLDNGESRRIVQTHVRYAAIPCLHGALAADGAFGRVVWDENFVIDDEPVTGAPTCEDGQHLPFIAVVSAYIARAAQEFIEKGKRSGYAVGPAGVIRV